MRVLIIGVVLSCFFWLGCAGDEPAKYEEGDVIGFKCKEELGDRWVAAGLYFLDSGDAKIYCRVSVDIDMFEGVSGEPVLLPDADLSDPDPCVVEMEDTEWSFELGDDKESFYVWRHAPEGQAALTDNDCVEVLY